MKKDVAFIIANYNTREVLRDCLESIYRFTKGPSFDVFVVDNASWDGSASMVRESFPRVRLIESPKNVGFGNANNLAAAYADAEYLFFLNSDTLLVNDAAGIFKTYMENNGHEKIGVLGTMLHDDSGRSVTSYGDFPRISDAIRNMLLSLVKDKLRLARAFLIGRRARRKSQPGAETRKQRYRKYVDYVTGADLFMRKEVFDEFAGFDPAFFIYYEETELQLRMKSKGYKRIIIEGPGIIHERCGSSKSAHTNRRAALVRFYRKALSDQSAIIYFSKLNKQPVFLLKLIYYLKHIELLFAFFIVKGRKWHFLWRFKGK